MMFLFSYLVLSLPTFLNDYSLIQLHARGDYLYKSGSETIPTPIDQETTKNDKSVDTLGDDLATSTLEEPIASTSNILPEAVAGSSDLSEVAETSENAIELTTSGLFSCPSVLL